jgi:hypothetical protein
MLLGIVGIGVYALYRLSKTKPVQPAPETMPILTRPVAVGGFRAYYM